MGGARLVAADLVPCALLELYGRQSSVTAEAGAEMGASRPTKKQKRAQRVLSLSYFARMISCLFIRLSGSWIAVRHRRWMAVSFTEDESFSDALVTARE